MRSYAAARKLFNILEFLSWIVIVLGLIVAFGGATAGANFGMAAGGLQAIIASLPGVALSLAGLYGLILVQISRASVDSAEYAQQSLKIAREQLEISREAQLRARAQPIAYPTTKPSTAVNTTDQSASPEESGGVSYADRAGVSSPEAATNGIDASSGPEAVVTAKPNALEYKPSTPLVDVSDQISYSSGKYFVGSRKFWSRSEAEAYAREQL